MTFYEEISSKIFPTTGRYDYIFSERYEIPSISTNNGKKLGYYIPKTFNILPIHILELKTQKEMEKHV